MRNRKMRTGKSCWTCKHRESFREEESWEMPHIWWWVHLCHARPSIANLVQFPFEQTTCQKYEPTVNKGPSLKLGELNVQ